MSIPIPSERRDPITHFYTQFCQRIRKLLRSAMAVTVSVTMNIALDSARYDFRAAVIAVRVLDQIGNEQRLAHHSAHQWALGVLRHVVSDGIYCCTAFLPLDCS
jgi:hypothetical protein